MAYPIRVSHKLWETPEITAVNRLDMSTCLIPFQDKKTAITRDRNQSTCFKDLNGTWKFDLLKRPELFDYDDWCAGGLVQQDGTSAYQGSADNADKPRV